MIVLPSSGHYLELHAVLPFSNSVEFEFPGTDFSVAPHKIVKVGTCIYLDCKKNVL